MKKDASLDRQHYAKLGMILKQKTIPTETLFLMVMQSFNYTQIFASFIAFEWKFSGCTERPPVIEGLPKALVY